MLDQDLTPLCLDEVIGHWDTLWYHKWLEPSGETGFGYMIIQDCRDTFNECVCGYGLGKDEETDKRFACLLPKGHIGKFHLCVHRERGVLAMKVEPSAFPL